MAEEKNNKTAPKGVPPSQMESSKEDKVGKVEEKATKKLDDIKEIPENKAAIAEAEGKVETKETETKKEKKVDSKPAVEKPKKEEKKAEGKIELEREYIVPLKRGVLNVPHYRRAKKAVRVLKEFLVKHMQVRDRDLRKVNIDMNLNNEIWFRGIKKPMNKIKVKAKKIDGIIYAELAEIPEYVAYKIAREEKAKAAAPKVKTPKKSDKKIEEDVNDDGIADEVEEKENVKAGSEMDAKFQKSEAKITQHSTDPTNSKNTAPIRKIMK